MTPPGSGTGPVHPLLFPQRDAGVARAFVLAAGLGVRLRPLSLERPKPAWPFFDVPLAAWVVGMLSAAGARRVVLNRHHLGEMLQQAVEPWIPGGLRLDWSPEPRLLGTGGALVPWREALSGGSFFLANADTVQEIDLGAMARAHRARGALVTLSVAEASPGGDAPLEVDDSGRVVRLLDARLPGSRPGRPCAFTGVHLLEPEILAHLPDPPFCIVADVHRALVARGAPVYAHRLDRGAFWSDLGTPSRYVSAHLEFMARHGAPGAAAGRQVEEGARAGDGRVIGPAFLGEGCRLGAGARVGPGVVLGRGSEAAAGARVERAVVWPGARTGSVRDAVVSDSGAVLRAGDSGTERGVFRGGRSR